MTAPTPNSAPEYETWMWAEMGRLQDALAAVTAERDQDRQMLADAPHQNDCSSVSHAGKCDCWKAIL